MPDIAMCRGTGCRMRRTCYRYMAKPTPEWQSYMEMPKFDNEKKECPERWVCYVRKGRIYC